MRYKNFASGSTGEDMPPVSQLESVVSKSLWVALPVIMGGFRGGHGPPFRLGLGFSWTMS